MSIRRKPIGAELSELLSIYQAATHQDKLKLAERYGVGLGTLRNWVSQTFVPQFVPSAELTWAEHLALLKMESRAVDEHHRIPSEIFIEIKSDFPIGICFTADWQLGEPGVDLEAFEQDTNTLTSADGVWTAIGGDGYSNIVQPAKMGSAHNQSPIVIQKAFYYQTVEKYAHANKCLFIGTGNHNWFSYLVDGEDWDMELSKRLKVVYTKHGAMINLKVGDMIYPIFRQHKGRFNSSTNITNTCKQYQRLYFPQSRVTVIEHDHVSAVEQYAYDGKECIAIRPGTYAVRSDYALSNGFYGSHVGNPVVILYPYEDRIVGFKNMRDGIQYLKAVRPKQEEMA